MAVGLLVTVMSMSHRLVEVMKPQLAWVNSEFRAKEPEVNPEGGVVEAVGFVAEVGKAGGVGRGKDEGLLGEDREDAGMD